MIRRFAGARKSLIIGFRSAPARRWQPIPEASPGNPETARFKGGLGECRGMKITQAAMAATTACSWKDFCRLITRFSKEIYHPHKAISQTSLRSGSIWTAMPGAAQTGAEPPAAETIPLCRTYPGTRPNPRRHYARISECPRPAGPLSWKTFRILYGQAAGSVRSDRTYD